MANSQSIQIALNAVISGISYLQNISVSTTPAGNQALQNIQTVGTSTEALLLGDVGTIGYIIVKNTDSTNYCDVAVDNADAAPIAKILAGGIAVIPASAATYYAKANTSAVALLVILLPI